MSAGAVQSLVVASGARACAIPLSHVLETLRPLPVEALAGAPGFLRGLSVIRGKPTPVLDLRALLEEEPGTPTRFVTLRLSERTLALAVDSVLGVRTLDRATLATLPPLLRDASQRMVEAVGTLDARLLLVLKTGWLLPPEVLNALSRAEGS
ncbi:MAG: chemotaxis protein CheW [Deltaproteobacteria bacterium]|nr:chemotaxis protein CheW [Deltaproteobacteria bacterium]